MRRAAGLLTAAALLAGCGGQNGDGAARPLTARQAADAARVTKRGLDRALEQYREGDRGAASDTLAATRGQHFDPAERRLRRVDPALARELRTALGTTVPRLLDEGVTVTTLARALARVEARLDRAARALERAG